MLISILNMKQIDEVKGWAGPMGESHPALKSLTLKEAKKNDHLVNQSVRQISQQDAGEAWLNAIAARVSSTSDITEAGAALAEIRAYGAMLEAGLNVRPIKAPGGQPSPDFEADAGDGPVIVEVTSKHEHHDQKKLKAAVAAGETPPGVHRNSRDVGGVTITSTTTVLHPGGAPDPKKPNDSVQANVISKLCAVKPKEHQASGERPTVLWLDLTFFTGAISMELQNATPLMSGHQGLTSGAIWYAFYGRKGAPIFEEDFFPREKIVPMGHAGRFQVDDPPSRFSASIITVDGGATLFENPFSTRALPDRFRRMTERIPWFDIGVSVANWSPNEASRRVAIAHDQILAMEQWHELLNSD